MKLSYLKSLTKYTVKKADLDSEIAKAKRLRDGSLVEDLLWNILTGGVSGGLGGAIVGGLGGGAKGFIDNTIPRDNGDIPYAYNVRAKFPVLNGGNPATTLIIPAADTLRKEYINRGAHGFAEGLTKSIKPEAIKGMTLGAGIGGLYSLLTYYYRKANAEKKLKELGIE